MRLHPPSRALIAAYLLPFALAAQPAASPVKATPHLFFRVVLGTNFKEPQSGRLLLFLGNGGSAKSVDTNPFAPQDVSVAAKEVYDLAPGGAVEIDTDDIAFPAGFSHLAPGSYSAQAVLDLRHEYNYVGRAPGDPISKVTSLSHFEPGAGAEPVLTLNSTVPEGAPPVQEDERMRNAIHAEDFVSPALSSFWGRAVHMRCWVVEPPGYKEHPGVHYPAVYYTHGFGGNLVRIRPVAGDVYRRMADKKMPAMIWILLDESLSTGTHEFADSVNNGPWGKALTSELIPYLESRYRLDARAGARFLNGHSSGGWATLWLQVTYPSVFGGTWSTSPDSSDFHDFTGPDLYAPCANVYRRPDGGLYPLVRNEGKVVASFNDFARLEGVLGPYGGQFASFEWVFSPRGQDGRPMPMFDRVTGDVDATVVRAWEKYDIARTLETNWPALAPNLNGKIHVIVGTADTFYLDGAAHKLKAVLDRLGANAQVTFLEGRTHFDLYKVGADPRGLMDQIATRMYQTWQSGTPSNKPPGRK
jgi:S-formylglutathione hydrolase FrmB